MFDSLSERLQGVIKKIKGQGALNESNIKEAMREVRLALLEADVNYKVVKQFVNDIRERAVGVDVLKSLSPGQQLIKVVDEELTKLMGQDVQKIRWAAKPPSILMMVGLQGSGKTTTAGKLANKFRQEGKHPLLVAADTYRPAAVDQLETVGAQVKVPVYTDRTGKKPPRICVDAVEHSIRESLDVVIFDTAGRLHINEELMDELRQIKKATDPIEILFVADAMSGQEAVNVAKTFDEALDISGVILTKMDGDARGGAALSLKSVVGKPIKFIGVGEKMDGLESFYPDRAARRILGMGDVLSLIEKVERSVSEEELAKLEQKIKGDEFTLADYRDQLRQVRKVGSLEEIMGMIPGVAQMKKKMKGFQVDEKELNRVEAIINSMTPGERKNHAILNASRRKRIARGSGTSVTEVNRLLKTFVQTKQMFKQMTKNRGFFGKKQFPGFS